MVFAEPDRSSISRMVSDLVAYTDPETVKKLAAAIQDNDKVLADAIAHSRVVLGFGFDPHGGSQPPKRMFGIAFAGDDPSQFLPVQQGTVKPLAILEAAAKGNGSVNTDVEGSVIRRVPMLFRVAGQEGLFPALSIEALRVAQGASTYLIKSSGASSEMSFGDKTGIVAIKTGDIEARTDARGRLALYDTGHREERFVSARAVLKDEVPPDKLDGQIVFIGTSAIGLKDLRSTPVEDSVPGVEVHAQLAEQMLEQEFLARPDFADGAEFLYLAAIGALFVLLLPRLSAGRMTIVAAIFIGIGLDRALDRLLGIPPAVRPDLSAGHAGGDLCQRHGARLHAHRARAARRSAALSASTCRPMWSSSWRAIPNCCSSAAKCARSP